jgi:L-rhamnose-H+ transport protein
MEALVATFFVLIAGAMNGSYAQPVKHMTKWPQPLTWLLFSCVGFVLMPIFSAKLFLHHPFTVLSYLPQHQLLILIGGGLLFGIGMICFTACYRLLGLGVSFVLNIAIGTVFGSLLPIFFLNPEKLITLAGLINLLALLLFVIAVIGTCRAASQRDHKHAATHRTMKAVMLGLLLGVLSGVFCSFQGAAYGYCLPAMNHVAATYHLSSFATGNLLWLPIFCAAFIPYALHHLRLLLRSKPTHIPYKTTHYWIYIFFMGIMYYTPLLIYSIAVQKMGNLGTGFGWPLLMSAIVLSSNFWGWRQGEWQSAAAHAIQSMKKAIALMIIAIILLSIGAHINTLSH